MALLVACSTSPVYQIHQPPQRGRESGFHQVQRGDTLYAIAFRLGMDFKVLARINGIEPPYRIYAGQRLATVKPPNFREDVPRVPVSPPVATAPVAASPQALSQSPCPATPKPEDANEPDAYEDDARVVWHWPLAGEVTRGYLDNGNKGVDISARDGEPVGAAANGKVVYSGQGLIGYGNLVIVKHNDTYLSAYGNNSRLLAKEGDEVKAGQPIAEIGNGNGRPAALHLEIRRAGKPVNPTDYLPRR